MVVFTTTVALAVPIQAFDSKRTATKRKTRTKTTTSDKYSSAADRQDVYYLDDRCIGARVEYRIVPSMAPYSVDVMIWKRAFQVELPEPPAPKKVEDPFGGGEEKLVPQGPIVRWAVTITEGDIVCAAFSLVVNVQLSTDDLRTLFSGKSSVSVMGRIVDGVNPRKLFRRGAHKGHAPPPSPSSPPHSLSHIVPETTPLSLDPRRLTVLPPAPHPTDTSGTSLNLAHLPCDPTQHPFVLLSSSHQLLNAPTTQRTSRDVESTSQTISREVDPNNTMVEGPETSRSKADHSKQQVVSEGKYISPSSDVCTTCPPVTPVQQPLQPFPSDELNASTSAASLTSASSGSSSARVLRSAAPAARQARCYGWESPADSFFEELFSQEQLAAELHGESEISVTSLAECKSGSVDPGPAHITAVPIAAHRMFAQRAIKAFFEAAKAAAVAKAEAEKKDETAEAEGETATAKDTGEGEADKTSTAAAAGTDSVVPGRGTGPRAGTEASTTLSMDKSTQALRGSARSQAPETFKRDSRQKKGTLTVSRFDEGEASVLLRPAESFMLNAQVEGRGNKFFTDMQAVLLEPLAEEEVEPEGVTEEGDAPAGTLLVAPSFNLLALAGEGSQMKAEGERSAAPSRAASHALSVAPASAAAPASTPGTASRKGTRATLTAAAETLLGTTMKKGKGGKKHQPTPMLASTLRKKTMGAAPSRMQINAIISAQGLMTEKQKAELNPMAMRVTALRNLPIEELEAHGFQKVLVRVLMPLGGASFRETRAKPLERNVFFNEVLTWLTNDVGPTRLLHVLREELLVFEVVGRRIPGWRWPEPAKLFGHAPGDLHAGELLPRGAQGIVPAPGACGLDNNPRAPPSPLVVLAVATVDAAPLAADCRVVDSCASLKVPNELPYAGPGSCADFHLIEETWVRSFFASGDLNDDSPSHAHYPADPPSGDSPLSTASLTENDSFLEVEVSLTSGLRDAQRELAAAALEAAAAAAEAAEREGAGVLGVPEAAGGDPGASGRSVARHSAIVQNIPNTQHLQEAAAAGAQLGADSSSVDGSSGGGYASLLAVLYSRQAAKRLCSAALSVNTEALGVIIQAPILHLLAAENPADAVKRRAVRPSVNEADDVSLASLRRHLSSRIQARSPGSRRESAGSGDMRFRRRGSGGSPPNKKGGGRRRSEDSPNNSPGGSPAAANAPSSRRGSPSHNVKGNVGGRGGGGSGRHRDNDTNADLSGEVANSQRNLTPGDAITGFVLDGIDLFFIFLEAPPGRSIQPVLQTTVSLRPDDGHVLYHSDLRMMQRAYASFLPIGGILPITTRSPLSELLHKRPTILLPGNGPYLCWEGLCRLDLLRRARLLRPALQSGLLPSPRMLIALLLEWGVPPRPERPLPPPASPLAAKAAASVTVPPEPKGQSPGPPPRHAAKQVLDTLWPRLDSLTFPPDDPLERRDRVHAVAHVLAALQPSAQQPLPRAPGVAAPAAAAPVPSAAVRTCPRSIRPLCKRCARAPPPGWAQRTATQVPPPPPPVAMHRHAVSRLSTSMAMSSLEAFSPSDSTFRPKNQRIFSLADNKKSVLENVPHKASNPAAAPRQSHTNPEEKRQTAAGSVPAAAGAGAGPGPAAGARVSKKPSMRVSGAGVGVEASAGDVKASSSKTGSLDAARTSLLPQGDSGSAAQKKASSV